MAKNACDFTYKGFLKSEERYAQEAEKEPQTTLRIWKREWSGGTDGGRKPLHHWTMAGPWPTRLHTGSGWCTGSM